MYCFINFLRWSCFLDYGVVGVAEILGDVSGSFGLR